VGTVLSTLKVVPGADALLIIPDASVAVL